MHHPVTREGRHKFGHAGHSVGCNLVVGRGEEQNVNECSALTQGTRWREKEAYNVPFKLICLFTGTPSRSP